MLPSMALGRAQPSLFPVSCDADWRRIRRVFTWLAVPLAMLLAFLELVWGLHGTIWTFLYHGLQEHGLKQGKVCLRFLSFQATLPPVYSSRPEHNTYPVRAHKTNLCFLDTVLSLLLWLTSFLTPAAQLPGDVPGSSSSLATHAHMSGNSLSPISPVIPLLSWSNVPFLPADAVSEGSCFNFASLPWCRNL